MNTPEFSLIITTYNSSRTIDQALKSVENLEDAKNIEVIISDDASQDDTVGHITAWAHRCNDIFNNIIVIPNEVNLGIAGNHTLAFGCATAAFGTYIGGDDYFIRPDFFRNLRRHIDSNLKIAKTDLISIFEETGAAIPTFHEVARFF
ncbi:MAG TPA: glycosyltransferase, partial [Candidatus Ozemobacteraceae bacterium]|nr:glycosyltransferase [Candidatus Ozemobacteraceae bacterium]